MKWTQKTAGMIIAVIALGCGGDDVIPPPDDSGAPDSTVIVDGGEPDSGAVMDSSTDASLFDAGPPTCSGDCDPRRPASECGGTGTCVLTTGAPTCELTLGTKAAGASCEASTDCLAGLACFARRGGGVCAEVCCPSASACSVDERCTGSGVLVGGVETDWWSCVGVRSCDVLGPNADCESGEGCYIVSPEADTDCLRGGSGAAGSDCVEQNDCAPGYFCAGVAGGTCSRICEIGTTAGELACPPSEGNCQAYPHSPDGSGICTVDTVGT